MKELHAHLTLKRIEPSMEEYEQALAIYENGVEEILQSDKCMIDHVVSNPTDEKDALAYALYSDDEVVGFCLFERYKKEGFICLEYISFSEKRDYRTVKRFFELLKNETRKLTHGYTLIEIKYEDGSRRDAAFEKLIQSVDVGTLDCVHFIPSFDVPSKLIPGKMMVYPKPEAIRKSEYLRYLHAMQKNYINWIAPLLTEHETLAYTQSISGIYEKIEALLPNVIKVLPF